MRWKNACGFVAADDECGILVGRRIWDWQARPDDGHAVLPMQFLEGRFPERLGRHRPTAYDGLRQNGHRCAGVGDDSLYGIRSDQLVESLEPSPWSKTRLDRSSTPMAAQPALRSNGRERTQRDSAARSAVFPEA